MPPSPPAPAPLRPPDPTLEIRAVRDGDRDGLISLIESCWGEYPDVILAVAQEVPELEAIATHFDRLGGQMWAVECGGQIVASAGWSPSAAPGGIELRKLYVRRAMRRRGLGAHLCGLVEAAARGSQAGFIELWTDTRFQDAHRLYERLGYVRGPQTRELHDLSATIEYYYRKVLRG